MKSCIYAIDVNEGIAQSTGVGAAYMYRAIDDHYSVNTISDTMTRIEALVAYAKVHDIPIISILNRHAKTLPILEQNSITVRKDTQNGFAETELQEIVRAQGHTDGFAFGYNAHYCVPATINGSDGFLDNMAYCTAFEMRLVHDATGIEPGSRPNAIRLPDFEAVKKYLVN